MEKTIREFSGRTIGPEEIEIIKWVRKTYPRLLRYELASTVCEMIGWNTIAGNAKTGQCLACLETLEAEGIIDLPKLVEMGKRPRKSVELDRDTIDKSECTSCGAIALEIVRTTDERRRWKWYLDQYHMLGYKQEYGSRLQYFIKNEDRELGCMQFSASSWALESREQWIGWTVADKKARLNLIINNSRYLLFPWVKVKNLASRALAIAARQIQEDWLREFCYAPVMLETFVDTTHFKGTCYKAANWIYLGETKGRGRHDRDKEYALSKKAVFMYPLQRDFKEVLRGEKAFKVVNADDM